MKLTPYQKTMLEDVTASDGYGTPIGIWMGCTQLYPAGPNAARPPALRIEDALTFVESFYILCSIRRAMKIYRGYETAGLDAPYGKDHPSFIRHLVTQRRPGKPDGSWWTPTRPAKTIDNLGLSAMHREEDRNNPGVLLEWNRLDFYVEAHLPLGSLVYVGRAAPQQEKMAYGGARRGGGGFQFCLTKSSQQDLQPVKHHPAR
jgi:hypothetical protein